MTDIAETIREVAKAQLSPAVVTKVQLKGDVDHDGDPILKVTIVFEAEDDKLDGSKVKGLTRHLREPLDDFAEIGFPVLNFLIAKEESPEAA